MKLNTPKATNITLGPDILDYLEKKLESLSKLLDPNDQSVEASVELGKTTRHHQTGPIYRAEVNLHIAGKQLRAEAEAGDLYSAIDVVKDELAERIRDEKEKKVHFLRHGGLIVKNIMKGLVGFSSRRKKLGGKF